MSLLDKHKGSDRKDGLSALIAYLVIPTALLSLVFFLCIKSAFYISRETLWLQWLPLLTGLIFLLIPQRLTKNHRPSLKQTASFWLLAFLAAGITLLWLVLINQITLESFSNSADEHSCWFLARLISEGLIWSTPPVHAAFFETPHIGMMAGKWFSVYPPVWPAIWAVFLKMGWGDWANPVIMVFFMLLFLRFAYLTAGGKAAALSFLFLIVSPFFLFNGASYYSHPTCLLLMTVFYLAVFRWIKTGDRAWPWALLAGVALGLAGATRYLTAFSMALPWLIYLGWLHWKRTFKVSSATLLFCFSAFIITTGQFLYNHAITGSFLDFPNHFLHSHEKLGFIAGYSPWTALTYLWRRQFYLMEWSLPLVLLMFYLWPLIKKAKTLWETLLYLSSLSLMFFYMLYYSWGGNQYGPRYFFEAYPFMVLLAASWITEKMSIGASSRTRKFLCGLLGGVLIGSIPILYHHMTFFKQVSHERKQIYILANHVTEKPALVFMKGFFGDLLVMSEQDAVRNDPFLTAPIIYAHYLESEMNKVCEAYPERQTYFAAYDRDKKHPSIKILDCKRETLQ